MELLEIIIIALKGGTVSALTLCSLILLRGGFYAYNQDVREPNKIQRMFGYALAWSALLVAAHLACYGREEAFGVRITSMLNVLSLSVYGVIYLLALVLRQVQLQFRHWVISLGPYLPALVASVTISDMMPQVYGAVYDLTFLYTIVSVLYIVFIMKKWDEKMLELYSDVIYKQTRWFRNLLVPMLLIALLWIPMSIWPQQKWLVVVYYLLEIVVFVRLTAYALVQEDFKLSAPDNAELEELEIVSRSPSNTQNSKEEVEPEEDATMSPVWKEKLDLLMQEEHLYRKEDITRMEIAAALGVNRTYLSQYINNELGMSFYEFINQYRLQECETLLKEGKLNVSEIAMQCGFRDRRALYRTFMKKHGIPPTEWAKSTDN